MRLKAFQPPPMGLTAVFVAAAAAAALAGPPKPKELKGKDITHLDVVLDGDASLTRLVPGRAVGVNVVATDKKGNLFSTAEGTLATKELRISATLGTYDPVSKTFTPEPDRSKVGTGPYTIRVECGPVKDFQEVSRTFAADFAALFGPEPADVQKITFTAGADEKFLVPGTPVKLEALVVDKEGRQYRTGDALPRLPLDRLEVKTDLVAWDAARGVLVPEADDRRVAGRPYSISVGYRGRPELAAQRTFIPDFAALRGPEPQDVVSFNVSLGSKAGDVLVPGSEIGPLDVGVQDKHGRLFRLRGAERKLPSDRLEMVLDNLEYNPASGLFTAYADAKKMVGKEYALSVSYRGRQDLKRTVRFAPDFLGAVKPFLFQGDKLAFDGGAGQPGAEGSLGQPGAAGREASDLYGAGADGATGGSGRNGRNGGRGGRGPRVKVVVAEALSADRSTRLILVEVTVGAEKPRYFLRPYDAPSFAVTSMGGPGGAGGAGGPGGDGGKGGDGYSTGSGGDGGDGGAGGMGGEGGPGGEITLIVSDRNLASSFDLEAPGGLAGAAGAAGSGGRPGKPGAGTTKHAVVGGLMSALKGEKPQYYPSSAGPKVSSARPAIPASPAGKARPAGPTPCSDPKLSVWPLASHRSLPRSWCSRRLHPLRIEARKRRGSGRGGRR